jgi:hypothetical protein
MERQIYGDIREGERLANFKIEQFFEQKLICFEQNLTSPSNVGKRVMG